MQSAINLNFIAILQDRLRYPDSLIQVILGPRQVGKTTTTLKMIEDLFPDSSHYVSAEQIFNPSPSWLREQWVYAQGTGKILFIDEIQKIQNWAESVKTLYDESKRKKQQVQCVLLGSSSLQIQKGLTESLTGRFQLLKVHHWNLHESKLGYGLDFETFLKYGGYPGSYRFIGSKDWADYIRNSIIATVIEKDILQYHTVKSPALFKQAFEIITSYPAQEISYTKLLGQLQNKGNVEVIKYYLSLYQGAFLIKILEKFSSKSHLRKASSPKILPLAPCLSYLHVLDSYTPDEQGRVFEALVGSQLIRTDHQVYYWRERNDEVDFVLQAGRKIWAIEVKSGRNKSPRGLERFKSRFPEARLAIVTKELYPQFEADPIDFLERFSA